MERTSEWAAAAPAVPEAESHWATPVTAPAEARCAIALRDGGTATISQVAERTGFSRPTADVALTGLIGRGLVSETETRTTGGRGAGRPARVYEFRGSTGFLLGIDIGSHGVRLAVADLTGELVALGEADLPAAARGEARVAAVTEATRSFLTGHGITLSDVLTTGLAVPGLVRSDGCVVTSHIMPDWNGVNVSERFQRALGCPVTVENDMRLASLAEHRLGAARGASDVICLFAGRRLSMGLLLGGRVRHGHHGAAGEVGDILYSQHADETGLLRWSTGADAEEVFRRAAAGDDAASHEIAQFARALSTGLATLTMGIDPDLIVVGGGMSRAGEALLDPLREAMDSVITVPIQPRIVASTLGVEAVVLGALLRSCNDSSALTGLTEPIVSRTRVDQMMERTA